MTLMTIVVTIFITTCQRYHIVSLSWQFRCVWDDIFAWQIHGSHIASFSRPKGRSQYIRRNASGHAALYDSISVVTSKRRHHRIITSHRCRDNFDLSYRVWIKNSIWHIVRALASYMVSTSKCQSVRSLSLQLNCFTVTKQRSHTNSAHQ